MRNIDEHFSFKIILVSYPSNFKVSGSATIAHSSIDASVAAKLQLSRQPLHSTLVARSLNGRKLTDVTQVSAPVSLLT